MVDRRGLDWVLFDSWGMLRMGWIFLLCGIGVILLIGCVILASIPFSEKGCNERAEQLDKVHVVDGDYKVWSNTCYLTLDDGRTLPADDFRALYGDGE